MLITKKLKIRIVPSNFKKFETKYEVKLNDIIEIDVNELSNNSPKRIDCICEICDEERNIEYRKYLKNVQRYNYYSCKKCKNLKTNMTKMERYGDPLYNNVDKMISTKEELGIYIPLKSVSDFKKYRKIVNRFTYKSRKILIDRWDGIDFYDGENIIDNFKLESIDMDYPTVDHMISIHEGFIENIPPYIIGNIDNICYTKRRINLAKRNQTNWEWGNE